MLLSWPLPQGFSVPSVMSYKAQMHQERSPGGSRQFNLELEYNQREKDVYIPEDEGVRPMYLHPITRLISPTHSLTH